MELSKKQKEEMVEKFKQNFSKKLINLKALCKFISDKQSYKEHWNNFVLFFLEEEFGNFKNFLSHAFTYESTKEQIFSFMSEHQVTLESSQKELILLTQKNIYLKLQKHLRSKSYKIRNNLTEDQYELVRTSFSFEDEYHLLELAPGLKMPQMYRY